MTAKSAIPVTHDRVVARGEQNPFSLLQHASDRLLDGFMRSFVPFAQNPAVPNMDVAETDKEIEITAGLPGLKEKDVQINVADNLLTVRGEKRINAKRKRKIIIWWSGATARSFAPSNCQRASISTPSRRRSRKAS